MTATIAAGQNPQIVKKEEQNKRKGLDPLLLGQQGGFVIQQGDP